MPPRNTRNTDCTVDQVLPEVCYRKNRRVWHRRVDCEEEVDPCVIDTTNLSAPQGRRSPAAPAPTSIRLGNVRMELECPGDYTGDTDRTDGTDDYRFVVPVNTFVGYVRDDRDTLAIQQLQERLDRLAVGYGLAQMRCFAGNETLTVECPEKEDWLNESLNTTHTLPAGAVWNVRSGFVSVPTAEDRYLLTSEDVVLGVYVYEADTETYYEVVDLTELDNDNGYEVVTASEVWTTLYAEDAQRAQDLATVTALSLIQCEYLSPEVTVDCPEDPNGATATSSLGRNTVTNTRGSIKYTLDAVEGDEDDIPDLLSQTIAMAIAGLDCVYCNEEQIATCPDADTGSGLVPAFGRREAVSNPCDFRARFTPTETTLPLAYPDGTQTVEELNQAALTAAWATLQCFYGNMEASHACPTDEESVLCAASEITLELWERTTAPVDEDEYESSGQVYCSSNLEPLDVDLGPVTIHKLEFIESEELTDEEILSLCGEESAEDLKERVVEQCPEGQLIPNPEGGWVVDPSVSLEQVVEAGLFLELADKNVDGVVEQSAADAAQAAAQQVALDYAISMTICLFCNDEIEPLECDPTLFPRSEDPEDGVIKRNYSVERPSRRICACEFTSAISKLDAQRAAWAAALSTRECSSGQYGNAYIRLECPMDASPEISIEPEVEAGTFFGETQYEADLLAQAYACSIFRCGYSSDEIIPPDCPPPLETLQEGVAVKLEAGFVTGYTSKAEVNAQAEALALALRVCYDVSGFGGAGLPGDQGPSGNCDTACSGVYA